MYMNHNQDCQPVNDNKQNNKNIKNGSQKHCISIYMQDQYLHKKLYLTLDQLHNLRKLKKKILNQFQYQQSQIKKIQLNIMTIYPNQPQQYKNPIFSQQNLKLIIDFLINYQRDIRIQAVPLINEDQQLVKKQIISQQAIDKGQLHFDQNGSLIQENDGMANNIPDNHKYDNTIGNIRCQFCQKNNQDKQYLKRCGGFYGPFNQQSYVHLLCALWCHRVFLNDTNNYLQNVDQQIKRSTNKKCFVCKQKGAGLVCVGQHVTKKNRKVKCTRSYHFKCACDSSCLMNWIIFKMLCPKCSQDQQLVQQLQDLTTKQLFVRENQQNIMQNEAQQNQNNNKQESQVEIKIKKQNIQKAKLQNEQL